MKNLKTTILSACIALCCLTNGNAQETHRGKTRGKVSTPRPTSIAVIGGGTSMPSSDGKDKAFLSNSTAINADLFLPLIRKGWDGGGARDHIKGHKMDFGLNVGGTYNFGGSTGLGTLPSPYLVSGQTSSIVSDRGTDPIQATFRMGAGSQANFYFGKFIVSPMVLGEYFSMTQKERSVVQTTVVGNQSYDFNLATLPETKTSGFAVTPKLRLHYMFNERFGLFADASYTTGPKIETTVSKLIPNGNPSPQSNSYNIQQLETGTMVKGETKSTAYSAMGFNFGVVIGLGRNGSKGWNGVAETIQNKTSGPVVDPPYNLIVSKECCLDANGKTFGFVRFKLTGTTSSGITNFIITDPDYGTSYVALAINDYTQCYRLPVTIKAVTSSTTSLSSTINGVSASTFTLGSRKFECIRVKDISIKPDFGVIIHTLLPEGPFRPSDFGEAVTWTLDDLNGLRLNGSGTGKDGGKIDISTPVGIDEETGKIFLTGTPEITKTVNGKTSKIKSDYKPTQKRDYVGHVTLLK